MTRWIRGRLGRPIASILFGLMLVSFLLPLAPPRAQAQTLPAGDLAQLFADSGPHVPIAVVDFNNTSTYRTGMLGRTFADALSMELMQTGTGSGANGSGKFEVVPRADVEREMAKNHLSVPLNWAQQAMLAKRLCKYNTDGTLKYAVSFTISGTIESVRIHKSNEGTTAEVAVRVLIISRVTGLPINGVYVVQSSSPKIGYTGNNDTLVNEALTTAAFQAVMKIMNSRVPIGTILTSPRNGEIVIKGGATIGFRVGMECTSMRRDTMTGRIMLNEVTPNESSGTVLEDSVGIAPGDKVVPVFEFNTSSRRITKGAVGAAGLYVAAIAAGALLFSLIATNNNNNVLDNFAAPTATALADAQALNYPSGANIVRWKQPSQRVVAYIIYRDTYPNLFPIAVVDGNQNYYIDSTTPLPATTTTTTTTTTGNTGAVGVTAESITYEITFADPAVGLVAWEEATAYIDTGIVGVPTEDFEETEYEVSTYRIPLAPGQKVGYQIKVLYMDYLQNGLGDENGGGGASLPEQYSFFLGNKGADSNRVTCVEPPPLTSPANNSLPTNGNFQCTTVPAALDYDLQYSTDQKTYTMLPPKDEQSNIGTSTVTLQDPNYPTDMGILAQLAQPGAPSNLNVFWRIGARVDGEATPTALADPTQNGYVYSAVQIFDYNAPPSLSRRKHGGVSPINGSKLGSSGTGHR